MLNMFKKIVATGTASETITVQDKEVVVVKQIGEGGNAEILLTKLTKAPKTLHALKRMSVHRDDRAKLLIAQWEFQLNTALPRHPNLVRCEAAQVNKLANGDSEFLMLLEYCSAGTLLDYINANATPKYKELMLIFAQLCAAVAVFHAHQPPISHRDLKPENVLKAADGSYKLCDFGSATTDTFLIKTAAQRADVQMILDKNTTPSYRAPEMCDLYRAQPINESSDVWALGVVLYQLLFREQPFADGPLAVVSGKYRLPEPNPTPKEIMTLLTRMLCMDVAKRATVMQVQLAVQEITGVPAVQAKPWTLGFTTASLAAKILKGTARAPSPLPPGQLAAPAGAVRETSKSGNTKPRAAKPLPAVPTYDGGDFNPSFPAPATAADSRAGTGFISPELMKISGALQWEAESAEVKEEKKSSQKREVSVSKSRTSVNSKKVDDDSSMREPSGTRPEPAEAVAAPPTSTTPIPASPSPAPDSSTSTTPTPSKRPSVILSPPPPPSSAGRSRGRQSSTPAASTPQNESAKKAKSQTSEEFARSLSINGGAKSDHLAVPTSPQAVSSPTFSDEGEEVEERGLIKSNSDVTSEAVGEGDVNGESDKATPLRKVEVEDGRLPAGVVRKSQSFGDLAGNKLTSQEEDADEEEHGQITNGKPAQAAAAAAEPPAVQLPPSEQTDDFGPADADDPFATSASTETTGAGDDFDSFDPFAAPAATAATTSTTQTAPEQVTRTDAPTDVVDATAADEAADDDEGEAEANAHAQAQTVLHSETTDDSFGSEPAAYNAETHAYAAEQAMLAAQAHARQIAEQYDPATAAAYYRQLQSKYASDPHYAQQAQMYADAADKAEAAAAMAAAGGSEPANTNTAGAPPLNTQPAVVIPVMDPRENDYLQYRYVSPTSERDEFLLISPRDVIHSDSSITLDSIDEVGEAVTKATKKDSGPPRVKYLRQLIVTSWKHRMDAPDYHPAAGEDFDSEGRTAQGWMGLPELFDVLNERPVAKHSCVAFKTLFLLHRLMQHGSPAVIGQLFVGRQFILALQQAYSNNAALSSAPLTTASPIHDLIVPYSAYLMRRIYFIYQYRQFEGNFSLGYYLYRLYRHPGWPHEWTMPVTVTRDQVMALITTIHSGLALCSLVVDAPVSVLRDLETEAVQLRDGILVPLMDDLYGMWLSATFLLNQLCLYTGAQPNPPGHASAASSESEDDSDNDPASQAPAALKSPTGAVTDTSSSLGPGATASEEDSVCVALPNLIAAHREVTIRLHTFFNAARALPIVASARRQPAMPGRVNPFQPTAPSLFPPPSNIPRLGLENPQLVWTFQHQCITAGTHKSKLITVDDELAHYHHQLKLAEQQQMAMIMQQQQQQTQAESAPIVAAKSAVDNPFGDDDDDDHSAENGGAMAIPPFTFPPMPTDGSMSEDEYQYRLAMAQQQYVMAVQQHQQHLMQQQSQPRTSVVGANLEVNVNAPDDAAAAAVLSPFHGLPLNDTESTAAPPEVADSMDFFASPTAPQTQPLMQTSPLPQHNAVQMKSETATEPTVEVTPPHAVAPTTAPAPVPAPAPVSSPSASTSAASTSAASSSSASIGTDLPPFEDEIDLAEVELSSRIRSSKYTQLYSGHWQGNDVHIQRIAPNIYNTAELYREFRNELNVRRKLKHPHLILFLGATTVPGKLCIVTELIDSTLTALLADEDVTLSWSAHLQIALDIAKGVSYLHQCKPAPIIHRALNPLNVLVDSSSYRAKIDVALTRVTAFESAATDTAEDRWKWTAPEVLSGGAATEKSDVFSFAILLWQLASHQIPYEGLDSAMTAANIMSASFRPAIPSTTAADYAQLIQACWQQLTMLRPSFAQIVEALTAMLAAAKAQKKSAKTPIHA